MARGFLSLRGSHGAGEHRSGLRRLREKRGLSQRELSEPGVSYAYISRVEAGVRNPSEKALRALACRNRFLDVGAGSLPRRYVKMIGASDLPLPNDPFVQIPSLAPCITRASRPGDPLGVPNCNWRGVRLHSGNQK